MKKTNCSFCKKEIIHKSSVKRRFCSYKCHGKSKIGKPSPRKGVILSEETKMKISKSKKGQRVSIETEFKKGLIPWNKDLHGDPRMIQAAKKGWEALRDMGFPNRVGKKHSGESKKKISESRKGKSSGSDRWNWDGGKPKCSDCGKLLSRRGYEQCIKCYLKSAKIKNHLRKNSLPALLKQQNSKEPTSIEKKVYDYLLLKGILFEKQTLINGKFVVDVYIPSLNLIIEADGCYWHGCKKCGFPKRYKRDNAENAYLTKCGYELLRLPEHEINNGSFKRKVVEKIGSNS